MCTTRAIMASLSDNSVTSHPSCRESARGHGWVASAEGEAPPRRRPLARCGGLLPSASADVRSSDDVPAFKGWWVGKSHRTHLSGIFPGTYAGALYLCLQNLRLHLRCGCIKLHTGTDVHCLASFGAHTRVALSRTRGTSTAATAARARARARARKSTPDAALCRIRGCAAIFCR